MTSPVVRSPVVPIEETSAGAVAGDDVSAPVVVPLTHGALATSGGRRRFVRVAGRRYSHLIDPRTARPVDHVRSATVEMDEYKETAVSFGFEKRF